ncbi:uncharacterized protein EI97DRAFT_430822 [Westerdykella ornata]|uniref:Uncharacterized protein n=1 Tax=Westerdykella ornata TaxID=318751 RepID=A0A6A6JT68_WESOR|nr:uncharacterized protein EI97DRAFT_430822 [Westerdykella ornata]KAF2279810.1 hypothetical protein EI97DRAFT_430822 [Westerdykella ornata]
MKLTCVFPLIFAFIIAALPTGEPPTSCGRMLLRDRVWGTYPDAANLTTDGNCHHWKYKDYESWVYYIDSHCLCTFHKKDDCSDTYKTVKTDSANVTSGTDSFIKGFKCTKLPSIHDGN